MRECASDELYDPIRATWVAATPEEQVRQQLIQQMLSQLGYPASLIGVEKELRRLPHLQGCRGKIPQRRADLICFGRGLHPQFELYPLLLVECKATPLSQAVINQVLSYNYFVGAPVVAVANADEVRCAQWTPTGYAFESGLPSYEALRSQVQTLDGHPS